MANTSNVQVTHKKTRKKSAPNDTKTEIEIENTPNNHK